MTAPVYGEMPIETPVDLRETDMLAGATADPVPVVPRAMLPISEEKREKVVQFLTDWINYLKQVQDDKQTEWSAYEEAYRARPAEPKVEPYVGACTDTIPVIAMAVEPVHARLETGIFKQDPFVTIKPIRKSAKTYTNALQHWLGFFFTKVVPLQKIAAPALLEQCKLGTMVFKVPYEQETCQSRYYDEKGKVVTKTYMKFRGPRPKHVSLGNFLFPPHYQHVQDCPIVAERQPTTLQQLRRLEYNKQLTNVDKIVGDAGGSQKTTLEETREALSLHESNPSDEQGQDEVVVYECWFSYDLGLSVDDKQSDSEYPHQLVATIHVETGTLLQLRYNPYYHQKYPYVAVPYTITNDSIYGIGIGEMAYTFQNSITNFHRNSIDNSYIANCRGFIRKRTSVNAEQPIVIRAGMEILVDDPADVKTFQLGDTYASTTQERQNLFGMVEKRTGVSDYMTGRESPALGSRATATSTLALIQEGTRRVEQVMSNERAGFQELFEMCMMIWAQFGLGDLDDYIFGDEETGALLDEFFKSVIKPENASTLMVVDISPTDATTNRQVQQQMQLGLIQMMTQYLTQVLQVGQLALQAEQQGMPQVKDMVEAVVQSAQIMYKDLLDKYDLPNADAYLPDILAIIRSAPATGAGVTGIPAQLPPVGSVAGPGGGAQGPGAPSVGGTPGQEAVPGSAPLFPGAA